jgi:hypothetical protein
MYGLNWCFFFCLDAVGSLACSHPELILKLWIPLWVGEARGSVVVGALCYKPEGYGFEGQWGEWFFSIYLILPTALGPGFAHPLKEIGTRSRKTWFLWSRARPVLKAGNLAAIWESTVYSRQYGIFNNKQLYWPPRPVTRMTNCMGLSTTREIPSC